jgi:hypothetical protein
LPSFDSLNQALANLDRKKAEWEARREEGLVDDPFAAAWKQDDPDTHPSRPKHEYIAPEPQGEMTEFMNLWPGQVAPSPAPEATPAEPADLVAE